MQLNILVVTTQLRENREQQQKVSHYREIYQADFLKLQAKIMSLLTESYLNYPEITFATQESSIPVDVLFRYQDTVLPDLYAQILTLDNLYSVVTLRNLENDTAKAVYQSYYQKSEKLIASYKEWLNQLSNNLKFHIDKSLNIHLITNPETFLKS